MGHAVMDGLRSGRYILDGPCCHGQVAIWAVHLRWAMLSWTGCDLGGTFWMGHVVMDRLRSGRYILDGPCCHGLVAIWAVHFRWAMLSWMGCDLGGTF